MNRGGFDMVSIPLHLQRRIEQRWAAKFFRKEPDPPTEFEAQDQQQAAAGKGKRKTRRVRQTGIKSAPAA